MGFVYHNENPENIQTEDCVVRSIALFLGDSWENIYTDLTMQGFYMHSMPSANRVWMHYLYENGFRKISIPDMCPHCYTIQMFAYDHPVGTYLVGTGSHVVAVIDGDYYDTWDSGDEVAIYYWEKGD